MFSDLVVNDVKISIFQLGQVKSPVGTLDFTIKHHRDWWIPSADWSHFAPRHVGLIWSYCVVILNDFGVVKLFSPHQLQ
jgi:hypothetical protein